MSLQTEVRFAHIMALQERNGFLLDIPAAEALESELRAELAGLIEKARGVFPPIWIQKGTASVPALFTPKRDERSKGYTAGVPFTRVELQVFNPGSRQQCGDRLMRLGWKPDAYGRDGSPTLNDEILAEMEWPQAQKLQRVFAVGKMLGQLADGRTGWLKVVGKDSRVHGRVNSVGCAPGRCSHSEPNMAQVSKKDLRMRRVWTVRPGWKLVGVDGASVQARALAHYLSPYDGGLAIEREINGKKELGTDTHSANRQALEDVGFRVPLTCADPKKVTARLREGAKRCFYCVLFGGSDAKLGLTVKEELREADVPIPGMSLVALGKAARRRLMGAIKGFKQLQEAIQARAEPTKWGGQGYLRALGGFHIKVRSKHSALVFLLQGFEQSIMKEAAVIFHFETAPANGWVHGGDFDYCAHVHDEAQLEAREDIAEAVGAAYAECIAEAGRRLGSRCPMKGEYTVGDNWGDTH